MAATMMVSFLSLFCLLVTMMTKLSHSYLLFYGLNGLKIAGEDDSKGEDEATHVDVEDIGNFHNVVLPGTHPLHPTVACPFFSESWSWKPSICPGLDIYLKSHQKK